MHKIACALLVVGLSIDDSYKKSYNKDSKSDIITGCLVLVAAIIVVLP